jgi:hypothetical protein
VKETGDGLPRQSLRTNPHGLVPSSMGCWHSLGH